MMNRNLISLLVLVPFAFAGCGMFATSKKSAVIDSSAGWDTFGAPIVAEAAKDVTVQELVASPADFDGKAVLLHGTKVDSVCKAKGCWMLMKDGESAVRITFKDYGFFVPTDCEGRDVVLEGVFKVQITPEAEVKHLLEDAGKHDEAAKVVGDRKELRLEATGVRMAKR